MLIAVLLSIGALALAYGLWENRYRYDALDKVSPLERGWASRDSGPIG